MSTARAAHLGRPRRIISCGSIFTAAETTAAAADAPCRSTRRVWRPVSCMQVAAECRRHASLCQPLARSLCRRRRRCRAVHEATSQRQHQLLLQPGRRASALSSACYSHAGCMQGAACIVAGAATDAGRRRTLSESRVLLGPAARDYTACAHALCGRARSLRLRANSAISHLNTL